MYYIVYIYVCNTNIYVIYIYVPFGIPVTLRTSLKRRFGLDSQSLAEEILSQTLPPVSGSSIVHDLENGPTLDIVATPERSNLDNSYLNIINIIVNKSPFYLPGVYWSVGETWCYTQFCDLLESWPQGQATSGWGWIVIDHWTALVDVFLISHNLTICAYLKGGKNGGYHNLPTPVSWLTAGKLAKGWSRIPHVRGKPHNDSFELHVPWDNPALTGKTTTTKSPYINRMISKPATHPFRNIHQKE